MGLCLESRLRYRLLIRTNNKREAGTSRINEDTLEQLVREKS